MPTILFNSSSGRNYTKKRKRMPGTDMTLKPEMKVYDGLNPSSNADVFTERIWCNLGAAGDYPDNVSFSWNPFMIAPPFNGNGVNQKVGKNYVLRFLKFKGFISVRKRCPMPISWRLVLFRYTDADGGTITRSGYLGYFSKKNTVIPSEPDLASKWQAWSAYNFYMKVLRSDISNEFRRKVIASGTLPAGSQMFGFDSSPIKYVTTPREIGGTDALYVPVDVSVQVNDLIDPDVCRYGFVLETDNACGYEASTTPSNADRTMNYSDRAFDLQIFCKVYFQDP